MNRLLPFLLLACGGPDEDDTTETPADVLPVEVSLDRVDFGEVWSGCTPTQIVRVTNPNNSAVTIGAFEFEGEHAARYSVDERTLRVSAGETITFDVEFQPTDEGVYDAVELQLAVAPSEAKPGPIALQGSASDNPVGEDTFVQAAPRDPDLLLVYPEPERMEWHMRTQVQPYVGRLITEFEAHGVDYRIGVLRADYGGRNPGQFVGDAITPETTDPVGALQQQLTDGTFLFSTSNIALFDEVTTALSQPEVSSNGMLRDGATLGVVAITDRGPDGSASDFGQFMAGLKRDLYDMRYHAIGPAPRYGDCPYDFTYGSAETLYDPHQWVPGTLQAICDIDSDYYYRFIAESSMGLDGQFELSREAVATSCDAVEVFVADEWIRCEGWDLVNGRVSLRPEYSASPGEEVRVTYPVGNSCEGLNDPEGS